jgi:hypothetical protein
VRRKVTGGGAPGPLTKAHERLAVNHLAIAVGLSGGGGEERLAGVLAQITLPQRLRIIAPREKAFNEGHEMRPIDEAGELFRPIELRFTPSPNAPSPAAPPGVDRVLTCKRSRAGTRRRCATCGSGRARAGGRNGEAVDDADTCEAASRRVSTIS